MTFKLVEVERPKPENGSVEIALPNVHLSQIKIYRYYMAHKRKKELGFRERVNDFFYATVGRILGVMNPGHLEDCVGGLACVWQGDPRDIPVEPNGRLVIKGEPYTITGDLRETFKMLKGFLRNEKVEFYESYADHPGMNFFIHTDYSEDRFTGDRVEIALGKMFPGSVKRKGE